MIADFPSQIQAGFVYILRHHAKACGFIVFYPRGDHLHVENVAVHPRHQGKGYGRALLGFAERHASTLSLGAVELYTNEQMTGNLVMYPRLGYLETARRCESGFDRVYFCKILDTETVETKQE